MDSYHKHRYYGESFPFGSRDGAFQNGRTLGYLSSEQALADYAQVIIDVKKNLSRENSLVIAVGASYGGSWFRLKYPHVIQHLQLPLLSEMFLIFYNKLPLLKDILSFRFWFGNIRKYCFSSLFVASIVHVYAKKSTTRFCPSVKVTAVELERVLTKGVYMLLYARCSPRAPRLIRNRIVSADLKNKCSPSKINPKNTALESRTTSMQPSVVQPQPNSNPPDSLASVESFYLKFHQLQRILEEDSSSDFSFTSSNSYEGSYSTDSTRDSTSTDDLSDYIFGGWNSWRNPSDSDTSSSSSSSSPLYSRYSPHADMNQSGSSFHERSRSWIRAIIFTT